VVRDGVGEVAQVDHRHERAVRGRTAGEQVPLPEFR
jgi:hypothetical protein